MIIKKEFRYFAIFLILSLFVLLILSFVSAPVLDNNYPSDNYNSYRDYNYNRYTRTNYDSRGYDYNHDSRYNDSYYSRYPTNYNSKYPDYYNRYDNGYNSYGSSVNPQLYPPGYSGFSYNNPSRYWSDYGSDSCIAGQDLILQIAPGGCSPSVVRSDLLEEQNVPVFCKIMAIKVNPLIDISRIRSIRVSGQYPAGISGLSYYPTRVITGKKVFDNPIFEDNLGYLVVVLSRQSVESNMSDYVQGNISAIVDYYSEGAYGIGDTNFYLSEMSDEDWYRNYQDYSFWRGRGYIRVDSIEQDTAAISIYRDVNSRQSSITLREGQTSGDIFLSGYYCAAGMNIRVDKISYPVDSALLQINDKQVWVAEGDRIIDAGYNKRFRGNYGSSYGSLRQKSYGVCRVIELDTSAGGGIIKIKCPGKDLVELSLTPGKVIFRIGEDKKRNKEAVVGDEILDNIFLGYVNQNREGKRYVVLVKDDFSSTKNEFLYKEVNKVIEKSIKEEDLDKLEKVIKRKVREYYEKKLRFDKERVNKKVDIAVIAEGKEKWGIELDEAVIAKDRVFDYANLSSRQVLAREYYDKSIVEYDELINLYPAEKREFIKEDEYAAQGLLDTARLSRIFGMDEKAHNFYERLLDEYPDSNSAREAENMDKYLTRYDTSNSKASVRINNEYFFIDLLDFKKPSEKEASAVILVNGKEETWGLNKVNIIKENNLTHTFKITNIKDEYIDLQYERAGGEKDLAKKKRLSEQDSQDSFGGINVKLVKINLKKQVKLSIFSKGYGPRTESNFNFKIGIEKRAIKISPEKAKDMLNSIKKSIKSWNDINEKLGNVVRGLKGACFATSAILTIKNLINGASGESLSRRIIMTNSGGWNDKCEELVNKGKYDTVHQCLLDKSREIENDINIYSDKVQETNGIIKNIQDRVGVDKGIFDFQGQVDSQKVEEEFKKEFEGWCKGQKGSVVLPDKQNSKVKLGDSKESVCNWTTLTHEQKRDIMTLYKVKNSGGSEVLRNITNRKLGSTLLNAKNYHDEFEERIKSDKEANEHNLGIRTTDPEGDSIAQGFIKTISVTDQNHKIYSKIEKGKSVVRVHIPSEKDLGRGNKFVLGESIEDLNERQKVKDEIGGRQVIVQVKLESNNNYYTYDKDGKIFLVTGKEVTNENSKNEIWRYMDASGLRKIRKSDKKAYQNKIKSPERLRVKYFERAPYKGLPAEVPFDIENGWYAEMTYVLSGFGKPYDESGRVINFYICNVGENGLIEFKKSADDICRYYNVQTGAELGFPGMTQSESINLIRKAQDAIQQAATQYGKERVTINGNNFETGTSFGGEEGRCTDFMSAKDCTLMFNVCDPVICPASRCDYGGRYRVDDVIQTGVIGSLLLCLPNYKEGIMIPICLSGVHAGLDGYVSILNSTAECLKESIDTGRNMGICDEIKSIYICDFFWKQAGPLMDVFLPSVFEGVLGQGVRGGGEYATVRTAWDNMKSAMTYFADTYAVNSMRAFSLRSTEYAGVDVSSEICKSFISSSFGGSVDFFRALIEPDSPVQYHAWFSENPMTTATYPPTSHYKVYYHIYSGKDWGAQYAVYLKDLEGSKQVFSAGYRFVARGYIPRGSQVDRAIDFIGPSGYKQLCVSVNGQEECGFGKVSTSYALNALSDQYAQEQLTQNIKSEKDCVAGTPSFNSIYNPNLQAGVENIMNPQLYNQGIIRVCSTDNPGKQVLPDGTYDRTNSTYDKWKSVGYCGDASIKCWLDTESVKDVIKDKEIEKQVLDEVDLKYLERDNYWTYEKSRSIADKAERFINNFEIMGEDSESQIENRIKYVIQDLKMLSELGITNVYRANAHYLLGRLYSKIAEGLWDWNKDMDENLIFRSDSPKTPLSESEEEVSKENEEVKERVSLKFTLDDEKIIRQRVKNQQSFDFVSKNRGIFTHDDVRFYYDASKRNSDNSGWFIDFSGFLNDKSVESVADSKKFGINSEVKKASKIIINEVHNIKRKTGGLKSDRFSLGNGNEKIIYNYGRKTGLIMSPINSKYFIIKGDIGSQRFQVGKIIDREIVFGGENFERMSQENKDIAYDISTCCYYGEGNIYKKRASDITSGKDIFIGRFYFKLDNNKIITNTGDDTGLFMRFLKYSDGREVYKIFSGDYSPPIEIGEINKDNIVKFNKDSTGAIVDALRDLRFDKEERGFY